jgi:DNA-binding MarR family transcriptional regulator
MCDKKASSITNNIFLHANSLMQIEQEVGQGSFRSEHHMAMVNLIFSSNWLLEKARHILEKHDLTHQQYHILKILKASPSPLSTLQLRERMLDRMSDSSRIVERLIKKGLVEKKACIYDKRLVDVTLSSDGHAMVDSMYNMDVELDTIPSGLTVDEAKKLNELLNKMRENL